MEVLFECNGRNRTADRPRRPAKGHSVVVGPGNPEEVARAVPWLASDAASFVVGHNPCVDEGFLASRPRQPRALCLGNRAPSRPNAAAPFRS
jgi:NAD(P)-dependent dehydrogenase (short-subunit alcohol dehydrogenase family)